MMIWLQIGHLYGSMVHRHILIGHPENLVMIGTANIVQKFGKMLEVDGMMRPVITVMDICAKQIYIEHVQPVLVGKVHT